MSDERVTFLLVDDDDVDVMAVRRAFKKAEVDHPLIVAQDGLEALEYLRGTGGKTPVRRPHIILLDLNMPRMNGLEFLRALREDPEHNQTIVFAITSSKDERQRQQAYEYNVAGYIIKSGETKDFVRLAKMLDVFATLVEFS